MTHSFAKTPGLLARSCTSLARMIIAALMAGALALGGCVLDDAEPVCGDDVCDDEETSDCGDCAEPDPEPVCGDGVCDEGETSACDDCDVPDPGPGPVCGDGACELGEPVNCSDCSTVSDASLTVTNTSSLAVFFLYVAPCSSSSWGPDQLGSNIIASGASHQLTAITPGCYDLRAEMSNGTSDAEEYGVELSAGENVVWSISQ